MAPISGVWDGGEETHLIQETLMTLQIYHVFLLHCHTFQESGSLWQTCSVLVIHLCASDWTHRRVNSVPATLTRMSEPHTAAETPYLNVRKPQVIFMQSGQVDRCKESSAEGNGPTQSKGQSLPQSSSSTTF